MQFSVIVPVYNAERTLDECVGSVLDAESRDFELILVNDGSRDNSAALCDAFAARTREIVANARGRIGREYDIQLLMRQWLQLVGDRPAQAAFRS